MSDKPKDDEEEEGPKDTTLEDRMTGGFTMSAGGNVVWDGELYSMLQRAARAYSKHFDEPPPMEVDDIPEEHWESALALLKTAVEEDHAWSEAEFEEALGDDEEE